MCSHMNCEEFSHVGSRINCELLLKRIFGDVDRRSRSTWSTCAAGLPTWIPRRLRIPLRQLSCQLSRPLASPLPRLSPHPRCSTRRPTSSLELQFQIRPEPSRSHQIWRCQIRPRHIRAHQIRRRQIRPHESRPRHSRLRLPAQQRPRWCQKRLLPRSRQLGPPMLQLTSVLAWPWHLQTLFR